MNLPRRRPGRAMSVAGGLLVVLSLGWSASEPRAGEPVREPGPPQLASDPQIRLSLAGPLGARVTANVSGWLLPCPRANPGLTAMFRLRDRKPAPNLVPWAGEFAGKYLISAIQALRTVDNEALARQVAAVVDELCDAQAEDGYLGPFPRDQRLLGNWDLWGHYHVIQALLMWHERTGDPRALAASRRAADLMARIYLDGQRRVFDAGSHEMNMAAIHGLGMLYRKTSEPRYRTLMERIEEDWQRAGDYLRSGLSGEEFFRTPRPRWESLHDLQGLVELARITGDARYRQAFLHHWASIRHWDRRANGAFSSGEQATGNPYEPTAIETCCTIAWMAVSLDALRISGDPLAADELELSTLNAVCGAQHPSGRWWTYNTPLDGTREASAHTIVFQARAGTPELNCCSVNGPRGLGMLSEWGFLRSGDGLVVNYYGPCEAQLTLADGRKVTLVEQTDYPLGSRATIRLRAIDGANKQQAEKFAIALRIPAWSAKTAVRVNGERQLAGAPGSYFRIERAWQAGDTIEVDFDFALRAVAGDLEAAGQVSLYRGPLLLAFDQADNEFELDQMPALDVAKLASAEGRLVAHEKTPQESPADEVSRPWLRIELSAADGQKLRLRDFATAGAAGTRYRSWLAAKNAPPPPPVAWQPRDRADVPPGRMLFTWRAPASERAPRKHKVVIAEDPAFAKIVASYGEAADRRIVVPQNVAAALVPRRAYYWKIVATNEHGTVESLPPYKQFQVDPDLPPLDERSLAPFGQCADGVVIEAPLAGNPEATYGTLAEARHWQSAPGANDAPDRAVQLDGESALLRYALPRFPTEEYTLVVRCRIDPAALGPGRVERLQQVASAWCGPVDDPLRLCLDRGKLAARIESPSGGASTPGVEVEPGRWYHLAIVKQGARLRLFVDGQVRGETMAPAVPVTRAVDFALGGNPHLDGEYLPALFQQLRLYARALSADEIRGVAKGAAN